MHFIDSIPFRPGGFEWVAAFSDNAAFEAKHNRRLNGRFAEKGAGDFGGSGGAAVSPEPLDEVPASREILRAVETPPRPRDEIVEGLKNLEGLLHSGKETPQCILRKAADLMAGDRPCKVPVFGPAIVRFGGSFKRESCKYLFFERDGKRFPYPMEIQMKNATNQLKAYSSIDEVIQQGKVSSWGRSDDHHPNQFFATFYKKVKIGGKTRLVTLDVRIGKSVKSNTIQAHNSSTTGNPGFQKKLSKMHLKDGASVLLEAIGVFML
mgnify:CR=1 FL=1